MIFIIFLGGQKNPPGKNSLYLLNAAKVGMTVIYWHVENNICYMLMYDSHFYFYRIQKLSRTTWSLIWLKITLSILSGIFIANKTTAFLAEKALCETLTWSYVIFMPKVIIISIIMILEAYLWNRMEQNVP